MEIIANNVTKRVGEKNILKNISLNIKSGTIYGLIGPNGAGKTTFSRLVMNIYTPTSGEIIIDGVNTQDKAFRKVKNHISCVMDNLGLYKNLTVSENVEFFHRIYFPAASKKERVSTIEKHLEFFGLLDKANDKITFFSKGERQRLALARACINSPKLIILDEPTTGLDVQGTILVRNYLQQLKKQGTTILINSHNLSELEKVCDCYGFINKGVLLEQNDIVSLKKKYKFRLKNEDIDLEDIYKVIFNV